MVAQRCEYNNDIELFTYKGLILCYMNLALTHFLKAIVYAYPTLQQFHFWIHVLKTK